MRRFSTGLPFREGGTASLYTARDLTLGRTIILKIPHSSSSAQIERTFREARALAAISHPGVCQVYEVGFDEEWPFIALEWVEGQPLSELAPELTLAQRLEIVAEVAEAIEAAHQAGVIHRDLKPENVVVRKKNDGALQPLQPVVVDFGLVRFSAEAAGETRTQAGMPLGTPGFMAPEQVRGDTLRVDARTDVYGLGALLYAVLTGHTAFEGEGAAQIMFRTLNGEPRSPRTWNREISTDLEAVVLQCLAADPARRYQRAHDVACELRRVLAGQPVQARRSRRLGRLARRVGWRRAALAAGFSLFVLTGATVAPGEVPEEDAPASCCEAHASQGAAASSDSRPASDSHEPDAPACDCPKCRQHAS
jgi:serine/threonine-protein kinase